MISEFNYISTFGHSIARFVISVHFSFPFLFATCAKAEIACGDAPKDVPITIQEQLKGDAEVKAQLFTKLLGSSQVRGAVEANRTELFETHKNLDQHQIDIYFMWVSCQAIASDKTLETATKLKLWKDVFISFRSPISPELPKPEPADKHGETINDNKQTSNKAVMFVYSSAISKFGVPLSETIGRRLENIGLAVTQRRQNASMVIEIESVGIDGPDYQNNDQLIWKATANIKIAIRRLKDNMVLATKDFLSTATTGDQSTVINNALIDVSDKLAQYLDGNRNMISSQ